ncbi:sorbosone dehydrogenase family protein [Ferrimonas sediminicola]|uniref:Sorbosone dehydrogenase family protein n=1 Tax=Ferrimonas sediminicola TaxID=2569538 RepID=A0A4U1BIT2_9GAMM|nr:PQQ-dependent sugar dehydrogenase [Ferrimonas sediminicola]TKB51416.1 sorbosone dehydrogenase family protein [Ferrimonas sediminicola]
MVNVAILVSAGMAAATSVSLPPGFSLIQVAEAPNARQMAWGDNGTLFVGSRKAGKVHALQDRDGDGYYERRHLVAEGLYLPSGVAFRRGTLYVAAVNRILAFPRVEEHLGAPKSEVVFDGLPSDAHHGWKFIRFAPDGRLIVPVGAPCNICNPELPYASILALDLAKGDYQVLARGVRNSVGFDFHPDSGELFFSDNGRDLMGDDRPPDEINRLTTSGSHFGYPFLHGASVLDPQFKVGAGQQTRFQPPLYELQAHVAPLGIHFYRGEAFPESYRHALFIAEHGSWNRSRKVGYRVSVLTPQADGQWQYSVVIGPWLDGEQPLARPVAFLEHPDGSLLISDDYNGAVYKLTYNGMPAQTADNENNE